MRRFMTPLIACVTLILILMAACVGDAIGLLVDQSQTSFDTL
jgi:hypothetical protein